MNKPFRYSEWLAVMLLEDAEFKHWPQEKKMEAYEAHWTQNGGYISYMARKEL